jgi:tripartite-type tricarboxylate transporter receptor subunit TctC
LKKLGLIATLGISALVLTACGAPSQQHGSGSEDVPSQMKVIVPFSAGGGSDTWTRLIAPYYENHLDGKPKISIDNQEGGESITATNKWVNNGDVDGKELLSASGSTYIPDLLNRKEVQYSFSKMRPVLVNGTGGVVYTSPDTGVKKAEDLTNPKKKLVYGGISATGLDLVTLLAFNVLDVDVDTTFGFEGRGPARIALERGEINLDYQTTSAYLSQVEPMIKEKKAVPLFSFGIIKDGEVVRDPSVPDLPTVEELYEDMHDGEKPSGEAYEAYRTFAAVGYSYQKGIWANEGTSDELMKKLQSGAKDLAKDKEFKEKSKEALGDYPIVAGDEVEDELTDLFNIDKKTRQYVLDMLADDYDAKVETK